MIDAQAVAYGPPASRAPHAPCGSADLPQVHADRDRGARDDDVAAVVARRQSPRFIANKFARCREGLCPLINLVGSCSRECRPSKRQHRSRSQRRFPEDALVANVGCRRVSPVRRIPAIVSFLNPQPALRLVSGNRSSCPLRDLRGQLGNWLSRVALRPSRCQRSGARPPRDDGQIGTSVSCGALHDVECRDRPAETP